MKIIKLLLLFFIKLSVFSLTFQELEKLEEKIKNNINNNLISSEFYNIIYFLIEKETNPKHLKYLSKILDEVKKGNKNKILTLINTYKNLLL